MVQTLKVIFLSEFMMFHNISFHLPLTFLNTLPFLFEVLSVTWCVWSGSTCSMSSNAASLMADTDDGRGLTDVTASISH